MSSTAPDLRRIQDLARAGRVEEALSACRLARMAQPGQPDLLLLEGRLSLGAGGAEPATRLAEELLRAHPQAEPAWALLGDARLECGEIDAAMRAYAKATALRRAPGSGRGRPEMDLGTSLGKLRHDVEQLDWLAEAGLLHPTYAGLPAAYRGVLASLEARNADSPVPFLKSELRALQGTYNRLIHWDAGSAVVGAAVAADVDWRDVERRYFETGPGIVVVDGLLTPPALEALRRFCLASTIWYEFRYAKGYLGAFMQDGFCCPLLLQIAEELAAAAPAIFRSHKLRKTWSFKCDSRQEALPTHADFAAVNVNFWLTPDAANLEPASGGLAVWDQEAPADWDFARYNNDAGAIDAFLDRSGAQAIEVGYRQNRALIFNSDLFHRSGALRFAEGYENRRTNVTMLYGRRGETG